MNNTIKRICEGCKEKEFCFLRHYEGTAKGCIKSQIKAKAEEKEKAVKIALMRYNKYKKEYNKNTDEVKDAKKEYNQLKKEYEFFIANTQWIYKD